MKISYFFIVSISLVLVFAHFHSNAQWVEIESGITEDLKEVKIKNGYSLIYALSNNNLYVSKDRGLTWDRKYLQNNPSDSIIFENTYFENMDVGHSNKGYVVGWDKKTDNGVVFEVDSYFETIKLVYQSNTKLYSVGMYETTNILFSGAKGLLVRLLGNRWYEYSTFPEVQNLNVHAPNHFSYLINTDQNVLFKWNIDKDPTKIIRSEPFDKLIREFGFKESIIYRGQYMNSFEKWKEMLILPDSVQPNSIIESRNEYYLVTSNGIYSAPKEMPYYNVYGNWYHHSTTTNSPLNAIDYLGTWNHQNEYGIAVGNNGKILIKDGYKKDDYTIVSSFTSRIGGCKGDTLQFTNLSTYKDVTYEWRVNDSIFSNAYNTELFVPENGDFTISLQVSNKNDTATFFKEIYIRDKPDTNLSVIQDDNFLCKKGAVNFLISTTTSDNTYNLDYMNPVFNVPDGIADSITGNNSSVTLNTGVLYDTTYYKLRIENIISSCAIIMDTLEVIVENPKAIMHSSYINFDINDSVKFFNHSLYAHNYNWDLGSGASNRYVSTETPSSHIKYNSTGIKDLSLVATTSHGCPDTTYANVTAYNRSTLKEDYFTLEVNGEFVMDHHGGSNEIASEVEVDDLGNIYSAGQIQSYSIESTNFLSSNINTNAKAFYLAKHDKFGVLQWVIYGTAGQIHDMELSKKGFIYLSGHLIGNIYQPIKIKYNDGSIRTLSGASNGFLVKIDKETGLPDWYFHLENASLPQIALTSTDDIMAFGISEWKTSAFLDADSNRHVIYPYQAKGYFLMKISENGLYEWHKMRSSELNLSHSVISMKIDNKDNLITLDADADVYKYSPEGEFLWRTDLYASGNHDHTYGIDLDVDNSGNIYMTGVSGALNNHGEYLIFTDAFERKFIDSTSHEFFIAGFDANGGYRWSNALGIRPNFFKDDGDLYFYKNQLYSTGYDNDTLSIGIYSTQGILEGIQSIGYTIYYDNPKTYPETSDFTIDGRGDHYLTGRMRTRGYVLNNDTLEAMVMKGFLTKFNLTDNFNFDISPPAIPVLSNSSASEFPVTLEWTKSSDEGSSGLAGYYIYRNDNAVPLNSVILENLAFTDTLLDCSSPNEYYVRAVDWSGNLSSKSNIIISEICDTPPTVPDSLKIISISEEYIKLSWLASTDAYNQGIAGYNIYRDSSEEPLNSKLIDDLTYTDSTVICENSYTYFISAVDNFYNESAKSLGVAGEMELCPDITPPTIPSNLHIDTFDEFSVQLKWNSSKDIGHSGLAGYLVYKDEIAIATLTDTVFTDTNIYCDSTYSYTISSYDNAGNYSEKSDKVVFDDLICPVVLQVSDSKNDIKVYPNPSSFEVYIHSKIPLVKVLVFDLKGREMFFEINEQKMDYIIPVSKISPGIYIFEIHSKDEVIRHKIQIIR